jgi:peptide/nickel transport system permease protein
VNRAGSPAAGRRAPDAAGPGTFRTGAPSERATAAATLFAGARPRGRRGGALAGVVRVFVRDRQAALGLAIIAVAALAALAAPLISPWDPLASAGVERLSPPGTPGHLLGTDEQGRDILSRLIWGGRASLLAGILPTLAAAVVALGLGLLAGTLGGVADHVIMRALDVGFAFPLVLLAIAIVGVIGPGMGNQMFALGVVLVPYCTRVVRTAALSVKHLEFVEAARALGAGRGRLVARHVLPNVVPPLAVYTSTLIGMMIVASAGLSFLGLGVQPPTPDWGVMVGNGRLVLYRAAHVATIPGVVIIVVALAFNFLGDGLREALDPRARR